jgi:hypothetical protein
MQEEDLSVPAVPEVRGFVPPPQEEDLSVPIQATEEDLSTPIIDETVPVGAGVDGWEPWSMGEDFSYDPNIPASKAISALKVLDRPRAANVGFVIAMAEGKGLDKATAEYHKGIKGEQHPLFGDFIYELAHENMVAQKNGAVLGPNTLTGIFQRALALVPYIKSVYEPQESDGAESPDGWSPGGNTDDPQQQELVRVKDELAGKLQSYYSKEDAVAMVATIGGIIGDVAADPVTYTGIGLTKAGKLSKIKEAVDAKQITITSTSKVGKDLADYDATGKLKPYEETLTGRLREGQERVLLGGIPIPASIAGGVAKRVAQVYDYVGGTLPGQAIRQGFSTEFGLTAETKGFKDLEDSFTDIMALRSEQVLENNAALKKKIQLLSEDLSRVTGENVPIKVLDSYITNQVELYKKVAKKDWILGRTDTSKLNSLLEKLPEKVRSKIRPQYLSVEAQEIITKDSRILGIVKELSDKNSAQLRIEQSTNILKTSMEDSPALYREHVQRLLDDSDPTQKVIFDPSRKRHVARSTLEKDLVKAKEAEIDADRISYFLHGATPEFKEVIKAQRLKKKGSSEGTPFVYSSGHASKLQRDYRGLSVVEINDLARAGRLPGYEGKIISKAFHDDPAVIQVMRDMRHTRSMEALDFLEKSKDAFGKAVTKKEAEKLPDGWALARNPTLSGYAFPVEVAKRLDQHFDSMMNPAKTSLFLKIHDPITNWYKAWTLGVFPEYHIRNAAGNIWNNFVTGTTNPLVYKTAMNIQHGQVGAISTPGGGTIPYDRIREEIGKLGVRNKGLMTADIEQSLINEMGYGKWLTLSTNNKAIHIGKKVGEAVDNNARIAKFVDELQKGSTFERAEQAVRHALFDYTDLTRFEKEGLKRMMPFYTWSRKNIPLQAEQMVRHPGKYKAVDTTRQEIEANTDDPGDRALGNWLLENYAVRMKIDKEDGQPRYLLLGAWLPAGDIWKLAAMPDRIATDLAHPVYKGAFEAYINYDTFKRKTINKVDSEGNLMPEKVDFLNMRVDPKTAHLLKNIRLLHAIDDMIPKDKRESDIRTERDRTPEELVVDLLTGLRLYAQDVEMNKIRRSDKKVRTFEETSRALGEAAVPFKTKDDGSREPNPAEVKAYEDKLNKDTYYFEKLWDEDVKKTMRVP